METNCIEIKNLNKFYGKKQALCNVNLIIGQGMFGLLGRNGAGKTTLMKTLATLLNKSSGQVKLLGLPVESAGKVRKIIGYLPQDFNLYPGMTVYEAMDYLGLLSGLSDQLRKKRIPMLLDKVNLTVSCSMKVKALSGGMKRRLGIAQALLNEPKVLIADEPTAGLDPEERIRFRNLLCETAKDRIVILSTHIAGDIEAACEKAAILDKGRIIFNGPVRKLIERADGKIFSITVPQEQLPYIKSRYTVTGMLTEGNMVTIRFIAEENPPENAEKCKPSIEDGYIISIESDSFQHIGGEI